MPTTTYFETATMSGASAARVAAGSFYNPVGSRRPAPQTVQRPREPHPRGIAIEEICTLIDAAGPLTAADIAGGLNVPVRQASVLAGRMMYAGFLKQDEFGRYRLAGACGQA